MKSSAVPKNSEPALGKRDFLGYIVLLVIAVIIYMSIAVKGTTLMTTLGYGDATDGSNILALIGVGAMSAGFLFGKVYRITRTYTLPISFSVMSIGMFLIASSNSVLQTSIAAVVCGFSFRTFLPYLFNKVSTSSAGNAAYRTSLILVGFNIGAAFSPYGIVVLERLFQVTSVRGIFYIEAAILLGLAVFRFMVTLRKPRRNTQIAAAE